MTCLLINSELILRIGHNVMFHLGRVGLCLQALCQSSNALAYFASTLVTKKKGLITGPAGFVS
jgi:hypothetical protein